MAHVPEIRLRIKQAVRSLLRDPALTAGLRIVLWVMFAFVALAYMTLIVITIREIAHAMPADRPEGQSYDDIRNLGLLATALFGAPFIVWRSWTAQQQATISEEGLVSDRFSNAAKQLTAVRDKTTDSNGGIAGEPEPDLTIRIAGLFALERLGENYPSIYPAVLTTICSYVMNESKAEYTDDDKYIKKTKDNEAEQVRYDIYMAIIILGRRSNSLRRVYEKEGRECSLVGSRLEYSDFDNSDFSAANLSYCNLSRSRFINANLSQTYLTGSVFDRSDLTSCNISLAAMLFTDLSETSGLTQRQLESAYGVKEGLGMTLLPDRDDIRPPDHWFDGSKWESDTTEFRSEFFRKYQEFLLNPM